MDATVYGKMFMYTLQGESASYNLNGKLGADRNPPTATGLIFTVLLQERRSSQLAAAWPLHRLCRYSTQTRNYHGSPLLI